MNQSVSDIIRLRFGWFIILSLSVAMLTPLWLLVVGGEDLMKEKRLDYLYQLMYLILGFVLGGGGSETPKENKP